MRVGISALLALTVMSCGTSAAADWVPFASKELGFSASFPQSPTSQTDTRIMSVNGKDYSFKAQQFSGRGARGELCIVAHSVATWPIVVDEQLATNRDTMASGVGATVTKSKPMTLMRGTISVPALQFDAAGTDHAFRVLEVIDGQTVFEVIGGVQIDSGNDADLDRCVKSFALITAK